MAKFGFITDNKQFLIFLTSSEGYETAPIRFMSFYSPSFEVRDDKFKFFENGVFKKSVNFSEIDYIGETTPEDALSAIGLLLAQIELTRTT